MTASLRVDFTGRGGVFRVLKFTCLKVGTACKYWLEAVLLLFVNRRLCFSVMIVLTFNEMGA